MKEKTLEKAGIEKSGNARKIGKAVTRPHTLPAIGMKRKEMNKTPGIEKRKNPRKIGKAVTWPRTLPARGMKRNEMNTKAGMKKVKIRER